MPILLLQVYLFLLAWWSKEFSYTHIQMGPIPLYVGEVMLGLMLVWAYSIRRVQVLTHARSTFGFALTGFLTFGAIRLGVSFTIDPADTGVVQTLKDSALVYQAAWVFVGLSFSGSELKRILLATLLGQVTAQLHHWVLFLFEGTTSDWMFLDLLSPPGNEVISPIVGIGFAFLSPWTASVLYGLSGLSILGLLTVYLKRSWLLSALLFSIPLQILGWQKKPREGWVLGVLLKRALPGTCAILVGLSLAALTEVAVLKRLGKDPSILPGMWSRTYMDVQGWFFHNETGTVVREDGVKAYSYMRWRQHLWREIWGRSLDHLWLGNGFGPRAVLTLVDGLPAKYNGRWISGPHNSYLTLFFRVGVVGIIPFAVLLGAMSLRGIQSWYRNDGRFTTPELAAAVFCSAAAYAAFNVGLENPHHGNWFWLFLGAWYGLASTRLRSDSYGPVDADSAHQIGA